MLNNESFKARRPGTFWALALLVVVIALGAVTAFFVHWKDLGGNDGMSAGLSSSKGSIGVIKLEGPISDSAEIVAFAKKLREDDAVKAVVLAINSPGGGVGPSQEIYSAMRRLAEKKPLVASMGSVAASGGYYSAAPAKVIYALPGTLTASIGVIAQFANLQELTDLVGVRFETFKSGKMKDAGNPFRPMTEEDRAFFQALVADLHDQFVSDVAEARGMQKDDVAKLADGRVMTGRKAQAAGLVDKLGGREAAVEEAKALAGLSGKVPLVVGPKDPKESWRRIFSSAADVFEERLLSQALSLFSSVQPTLR